MKNIPLAALVGLLTIGSALHAQQPRGSLTIEQLVDIRHPSTPIWSPDGRMVLFTSERAGTASLVVSRTTTPTRTGTPPVTTVATGQVGNPFWSADSRTIYFTRDGDLWQVAPSGEGLRATWTTPGVESSVTLSPDGNRVAFVRASAGGAALVTRSLSDGRETEIAQDPSSIGVLLWSPDGARLAFASGSRTIRHEQTPEYSGSKIIYTIAERTPPEYAVAPASGGATVPLKVPPGFGGLRWLDASHVLFDRQGSDYKTRSVLVAEVTSGELRTLFTERDAKFWSIPGQADPTARPSPDGKWIAFVSDRDSWDHI